MAIEKQCIVTLIRRSRVYAEIEKFDLAKADYRKALELDKEKKYTAMFGLVQKRYQAKFAQYKANLKVIEDRMAKNLMSGDEAFITEMTKSAEEDLENKEY